VVNDDRAQLAKILVHRSHLHRKPGEPPFTLASGKTSDFYFDCQKTTRLAEAMPLIGRVFLAELAREGVSVRSVGGLAQGADPIAQAIAHSSHDVTGSTIDAFSVRKQRKAHGTQQWIEGCAPSGTPVAVVDDVITTGGSVLTAIERCKEEGLSILQVIVLVDREDTEARAMETIRRAVPGVPVSAIFTKRELDSIDVQERGQSPAN
jgi:orotate phosphoribosyltransferase